MANSKRSPNVSKDLEVQSCPRCGSPVTVRGTLFGGRGVYQRAFTDADVEAVAQWLCQWGEGKDAPTWERASEDERQGYRSFAHDLLAVVRGGER